MQHKGIKRKGGLDSLSDDPRFEKLCIAMTKYSHLNREQRYQIESLLQTGHSFSSIADLLGCHKSTISRELKRNMPHAGQGALVYRANRAHEKTRRRHRFKPKRSSFTLQMKERLIPWLQNERLSPELISVLGRRENPDFVSHETIYKWLLADEAVYPKKA